MADLTAPRVRFAPSPTGELHLGGLRTAYYDWLLARKYGGTFVLRIEDTDRTRYVEGAEERLLATLQQLGLQPDEGPGLGGEYGPYRQSERLSIYHEAIQELIEKKQAYYCTCTPERLEKMRAEQSANKQAPGYDRHCRDRYNEKPTEPHVVRFRMPDNEKITVNDFLRGNLNVATSTLDDFVILKADGFPTYHSAVVIDDHAMQITHVLRGEEWLPSLPKHVLLYQAFGWEAPVFVHLPLILGKDKKKLSKRHGAHSVEKFLQDGVLSEPLLNAIALLGWHASDDQEKYTRQELLAKFSLEGLQKSSAVFDPEKLAWLNAQYIKTMDIKDLSVLARPYISDVIAPQYLERLDEALPLVIERITQLSELPERLSFLQNELHYDQEIVPFKTQSREEAHAALQQDMDWLMAYNGEWGTQALEKFFHEQVETLGKKVGEYFWPLRVALSGKKASPGTFELLHFFGREEAQKRIQQALQALQ
ncbi:MAG: glutamate--tRNA ligase [Candidatus Nomurabacteria bacterium]|nr:MAG: glutamate--tRNA ligase [Candidatus Nomurabacteria bacterium]